MTLWWIFGFGLLALLTSIPMYTMPVKDRRITSIRSALRNGGIAFMLAAMAFLLMPALFAIIFLIIVFIACSVYMLLIRKK